MKNLPISLSVKNVTVSYRNGHRALWNASFEIPYSTITALVGVNGAGKSTLFKAIMGFLPISGGTININGQLYEGYPIGINEGYQFGSIVGSIFFSEIFSFNVNGA